MRAFITALPGLLLMVGIGVFSNLISQQIVFGGRHPLEGVTIAILIGLFIRNLFPLPTLFHSGLLKYETFLKSGIVFLGIGLSFYAVLSIGAKAVGLVVLCLLIAPLLFYFIGRRSGLPEKMNILIGIGTTICGSTAIAITAPLIEADGKDVSYAIATISIFGIAAMLILPLFAGLLGLSPSVFGLWAGTAIHATPQVVAAGYMYGEIAGQVATVVKLTRNIFMAPAVFLIGLWYLAKRSTGTKGLPKKTRYTKAVPLFVFGFLALALIRTIGDRTTLISTSDWQRLIFHINQLGKFLVLIAMAGIGLMTRLSAMRQVGAKPFMVGLITSVLLAGISLILIYALNIS